MAKIITSLKSSSINVGTSQAVFTSGTVSNNKVTYTTPGQTSIVIPAGVTQILVKCWGAAGGGGRLNVGFGAQSPGGGGAYASSTLAVNAGENYIVTVGAAGAPYTTAGTSQGGGGNNGSGNAGGGNARAVSFSTGTYGGGGGQYSALHQFTGTNYILKTCAGGGGGGAYTVSGGGGGCDGNAPSGTAATAGANGIGGIGGFLFVNAGNGSNYVANATTVGSSAMNLNGGTGGLGGAISGACSPGGGGGYGGGGGGSNAVAGQSGAGGGSYGDTIVNGAQTGGAAANNTDPDFIAGKATGNPDATGGDGLVVVYFLKQGAIFTSPASYFTGTLGATQLFTTESKALTASVTEDTASNLQLAPTYTNSTANTYTITRHNYSLINNPVLTNTGGGSIVITDAAVMKFDAAAGTHKAVDSGTTKTTPGTVDAWIKINLNDTILYVPCYSSKTA